MPNSLTIRLSLIAAFLATPLHAAQTVELARGMVPNNPQQPQVAVDAAGHIHLVYGVGDVVRYRGSSDGGQTFTDAVDLPSAQEMSLGMRRGPRIAITDKVLCVSAIGGKQGKGRDGDVLAIRSLDGGKTWTEPVQVNDVADSAREGLHAMSGGPGGQFCCVWLDLRHGKTEVMASISTDKGQTWSKDVLVYRSPDGSVCECCHPSVAIDKTGQIHVLWRNSLDGHRDMYHAVSTDAGKTFGQAVKLGTGAWRLDRCPMDGGALAVADQRFFSVWRRDKEIFLTQQGDRKERRLGVGEQPSVAATKKGPYVVWLKQRGDVAWLLTPGSDKAGELAGHASDPVVAAAPEGRGPVVAVWETRVGKSFTVQFQVLSK